MSKEQQRLVSDLSDLSNRAQKEQLSKEYWFQEIAKLDKKHESNPSYFEVIEGVIFNIGLDQEEITIINYGIDRLQKKKEKIEPNKFYYDLTNAENYIADLKYDTKNLRGTRTYYDSLLKTKDYNDIRKKFTRVKFNEESIGLYSSACTNSANLLERYGRNFEALNLYDKALRRDPNFGMALGNKARAIEYYIELLSSITNCIPIKLLYYAKNLYEKSLVTNNVLDVGGQNAYNYFFSRLNNINAYFEKEKLDPKFKEKKIKNDYYKFTLQNNIFLNFDFGYYYDKSSLKDNFFPELTENIKDQISKKTSVMSEKTYFSFQMFNQILEDYTSSRYLFYMVYKNDYQYYDENIDYIYTFDYTKNSMNYGILKKVFSNLYNCLDKIAHIIYRYFDLACPKNIYFSALTKNEFKDFVASPKSMNYQLLALYNLACDFDSNNLYNEYQKVRNKVTHEFLSINLDFKDSKLDDAYGLTEEVIFEYTREMFIIVKAAVMYMVIAISDSNSKKLPKITSVKQSEFF